MVSLLLCLSLFSAQALAENNPIDALRNETLKLPYGTGFVFRSPKNRKYVVTVMHVCLVASLNGEVFGSYENGQTVKGRVIALHYLHDLCLIDIGGNAPSRGIALGTTYSPAVDMLYSRGYPLNILSTVSGLFIKDEHWKSIFPLDEIGPVCPAGTKPIYGFSHIVSGCEIEFYQSTTSMFAAPGSSGSPVVKYDGTLVGLVASVNRKNEAGIVRFSDVKSFLEGR